MSEKSISMCEGKGSLSHNNREFTAKNIDSSRTPNNVVFVQQALSDAYHQLFDEAVEKYNARQKRNDRKIHNYFEHLFNRLPSKSVITGANKQKSFYEHLVYIGTRKDTGVGTPDAEITTECLREYMEGFQARNPNLYVFNAVLHLDESTPHFHINYMDLVSDNPCRKVTIPKGEVKEKPIYSQEEIAQLLTAINGEDTKYRAFFYLIAYSGFRRSEMLGLEWKDIDFENNIISIKRTSNYTSERGIYTDTTKTKRSKRVLKISPYIMGILKELKDEQDEEALRLGDKWVESDRLFVKWNGEPMNNQTPYGWLKEFCEKNDMPFYGIHSFRHFAASALISSGLDVVTVSGALGHCNSGTTLNVYAHMFQTAQARVAQAMDGAFSFLPQDSTR